MVNCKVFNLLPEWQQEYMVTSVKNPKYLNISNALFIASTFNPISRFFGERPIGIMPGAYTAYHFCRTVDDMADGDCSLPLEYTSFLELVDDLKHSMDKKNYPNSDLGVLLRGTIRDIKDYRGVDIRSTISRFLDAMLFENNRRVNRIISTQGELQELYSNSFSPPQDLAFISAGSKIRSENIPDLAQLQGRVYAIRDLESELRKGIIFVPKEIFLNGINYEELCNNPYLVDEIRNWVAKELNEASEMINGLKRVKTD